jgi:tRNA-2-methylthio-N6-dimethylallyladenosine synthase
LLQAVRDLPKVAQYLHVPVQSGCDEVLKRMKRGYTVGEYREMHSRIRETLPNCAVSSDFIVGMCGETEESYQKSLDLIRECRFKNSFIFKYSPRPGTKAIDLWDDDVPEDVKRHRNNEMLDLQNRISEEDNANLIGSSFEVLVEGISKSARKAQLAEENDASFVPTSFETTAESGPTQLVGRTRCDRIVVFNGNPRLAGSLAEIAIHDCSATTLLGSIVTHESATTGHASLPVVS